eukprot:CAMPEP_0174238426 /NCGR_PEP_ID=MMETSP0417-20130205/11183_1 /TAXON_ID=242541 /ORGANISM="Mayorella sp, Strain BSH-02190019" /LENGTH=1030 /DNA_ID=CAMNT_0015317257 /DNA_START=31 /DNA_END=3120 /DNA_ORIENTATION=+
MAALRISMLPSMTGVYQWGSSKHSTPSAKNLGLFLREDIRDMACNYNLVIVLTDKGDVYTVGTNRHGELGIGSSPIDVASSSSGSSSSSSLLEDSRDFSAVPAAAAAAASSLSSSASGTEASESPVAATGSDRSEPTGRNQVVHASDTPQLVRTLQGRHCKAVACNTNMCAAVCSDGELVYMWGLLLDGTQCSIPRSISFEFPVKQLSLGATHAVALVKVDGHGVVFTWGENAHGQLGNGNSSQNYLPPSAVEALKPHNVVQVAAGDRCSVIVTADHRIYAWGENMLPGSRQQSFLGVGSSQRIICRPSKVSLGRKVKPVRVAAGQTHFLCISERSSGDRLLYSWGLGSYGQLGLDDCLLASTPTRVKLAADRQTVKDVSEIHCGLNHSVIMSVGGLVWTCGAGVRGCLGHADEKDLFVPTLVKCQGKIVNAFKTAAGGSHTLAVLAPLAENTFGRPLHEVMTDPETPPYLLKCCFSFLEHDNLLDTPGLYSNLGNEKERHLLERLFDTGETVDLNSVKNIHSIAQLVKEFLWKLPDSLIPSSLYSDVLKILAIPVPSLRVYNLGLFLYNLPTENVTVLRRLMLHFRRLRTRVHLNDIQFDQLAAEFRPILLRAKPELGPMESFQPKSDLSSVSTLLVAESSVLCEPALIHVLGHLLRSSVAESPLAFVRELAFIGIPAEVNSALMNIGEPDLLSDTASSPTGVSSPPSSQLQLPRTGSLQSGIRGAKSPRPERAIPLEVLVEQIDKLTQAILDVDISVWKNYQDFVDKLGGRGRDNMSKLELQQRLLATFSTAVTADKGSRLLRVINILISFLRNAATSSLHSPIKVPDVPSSSVGSLNRLLQQDLLLLGEPEEVNSLLSLQQISKEEQYLIEEYARIQRELQLCQARISPLITKLDTIVQNRCSNLQSYCDKIRDHEISSSASDSCKRRELRQRWAAAAVDFASTIVFGLETLEAFLEKQRASIAMMVDQAGATSEFVVRLRICAADHKEARDHILEKLVPEATSRIQEVKRTSGADLSHDLHEQLNA